MQPSMRLLDDEHGVCASIWRCVHEGQLRVDGLRCGREWSYLYVFEKGQLLGCDDYSAHLHKDDN